MTTKSIFNHKKFDGSDYLGWRRNVINLLNSKNLVSYTTRDHSKVILTLQAYETQLFDSYILPHSITAPSSTSSSTLLIKISPAGEKEDKKKGDEPVFVDMMFKSSLFPNFNEVEIKFWVETA